jgi:hypothetical protein
LRRSAWSGRGTIFVEFVNWLDDRVELAIREKNDSCVEQQHEQGQR